MYIVLIYLASYIYIYIHAKIVRAHCITYVLIAFKSKKLYLISLYISLIPIWNAEYNYNDNPVNQGSFFEFVII